MGGQVGSLDRDDEGLDLLDDDVVGDLELHELACHVLARFEGEVCGPERVGSPECREIASGQRGWGSEQRHFGVGVFGEYRQREVFRRRDVGCGSCLERDPPAAALLAILVKVLFEPHRDRRLLRVGGAGGAPHQGQAAEDESRDGATCGARAGASGSCGRGVGPCQAMRVHCGAPPGRRFRQGVGRGVGRGRALGPVAWPHHARFLVARPPAQACRPAFESVLQRCAHALRGRWFAVFMPSSSPLAANAGRPSLDDVPMPQLAERKRIISCHWPPHFQIAAFPPLDPIALGVARKWSVRPPAFLASGSCSSGCLPGVFLRTSATWSKLVRVRRHRARIRSRLCEGPRCLGVRAGGAAVR